MRVLVHGMQSSGAYLVTYFLGQIPESIALVDLVGYDLMPALSEVEADCVTAKCIVSTYYDFADHERSVKPDRTVLVLRHPFHNYTLNNRNQIRQ